MAWAACRKGSGRHTAMNAACSAKRSARSIFLKVFLVAIGGVVAGPGASGQPVRARLDPAFSASGVLRPIPTVDCCALSSWQQAADSGPPGRELPAMTYDETRDEVVLFGGATGSGVEGNQTWLWNGVSWRHVPVFGPPPRAAAAMVFDSARQRAVLYGGRAGVQTRLGDAWEWDGQAWLRVAGGPPATYGHMMAYDSARKVTVLFGGESGSNDVWEWNGTSWTMVAAVGDRPRPRAFGGMVYDAGRGRTVLFGGLANRLTPLNDTWEWDGHAWTGPFPGPAPSARYGFAMTFESGCGRALVYGGGGAGGLSNETWERRGTGWSLVTSTGPTARFLGGYAYVPTWGKTVIYAGSEDLTAPRTALSGETWHWGCPCEEDAAPLDAQGQVILPAELIPGEPIIYTDVDMPRGYVDEVYRGFDTSTDDWIDTYPCDFDVAGTIPPEASNPDVAGELAALGIVGDPQAIVDTLTQYNDQIGVHEMRKKDGLRTAAAVTATPYTPPAKPYCPDPANNYWFGGRDIVYIHGFDGGALADKIAGDPRALTTWPADRDQFYRDLHGSGVYGWWKRSADQYWDDHIQYFLRDRSRKNRYLIVAWPSTQRLEDGIRCVMEQIDLAMRDGTGVINPVDPTCTQKFGTPSYVIISHSTGSLLTDSMLAAAARNPNLNAQHIARYCKMHVSVHGTTSGSQYATPVVALSGILQLPGPPSWLCPLAVNAFANYAGVSSSSVQCSDFTAVQNSVLVDLVPAVAQLKWGIRYVSRSPVRTVSVTGGHPSYLAPLKYILADGYDDGVTTANSQAMGGYRRFPPIYFPNWWYAWPSGFVPFPAWPQVFSIYHMGVEFPRAVGLFIDQRFWHLFSTKLRVAGGPSPNKSPLGKVQKTSPLLTALLPPWMQCRNRYPLHYAYLFSPSDHFADPSGQDYGYVGSEYADTNGVANWEETVCITRNDRGIYVPFTMPYGDNGPVLDPACRPREVDFVRGRTITFKIRLFGKTFTKTWWLWRRHFFILDGAQTRVECDYVYQNLLCNAVPCTGCVTCPPCLADFNGDCVVDDFDLFAFEEAFAAGDIRADMNHDGLLDDQDRALFMSLWRVGC